MSKKETGLRTCPPNRQQWVEEPWIRNFGVKAVDPGFIYIIENSGKYKIGRSKSASERIKCAKTWLPEMKLIGVKPFWQHRAAERVLHVGYAACWCDREWFEPYDEGYLDALIPEFQAFSDADINRNSVNFIYWINGSGMAEFIMAQGDQKKTIRQFQRETSSMGRKR